MMVFWSAMARRIPAPNPVVPVMLPPLTRWERSPPSMPPSEDKSVAPVVEEDEPLGLSASKATLKAWTISLSSRASWSSMSSSSVDAPPPSCAAAEHSRRAVTA